MLLNKHLHANSIIHYYDMISITRLPQAKKNLEQELKRVYDSVYERYVRESPNPLEDKDSLFSLTEDELIDKLIIESNDEELTDKDFLEIKERVRVSEFWKAYYRFLCLGKRLERYIIPFPKVGAAMLTFSYDLIVRSFLFSNWRWKDEEIDLSSIDLSLSSDEIYQIFQNVNPDVASVFISKLEDCSIADKELLQEALDSGQKEVFIDKLKALSISDYNSLVLLSTLLHLENALISNDWETLRTLLYIDFEESFPLDVVSILPSEEVISMMDDDYWEREFNFEGNLSEEEVAKRFNAASDKMESNIDLLRRLVYGGLKYKVPVDLDTYKLFPFERKYVVDILNDPDVKSILDELPENPDMGDITPDEQEQPEKGNYLDGRKKRSLDDFEFVKDAHFDALYKRIEEALFLYDAAQYCLFCDNCRLPLEQALYEFYHIAGIAGKKIPDLPSGMIARLPMYLPEDVFPLSYKALYTDLNKITCRYHHVAKYPPEEEWHDDAKKCYQLMIQCFHQLVEFKKEFPQFIDKNGPIDFQKNLSRVLAGRRVLPQFNSATYSRQPDYTSIALAHINLKESYRESLELELPKTYGTILEETKDTYEYLLEVLRSSFSIDSDDRSLAYLEQITEFVPQVIATRHLYSYFALIHSILFRDSWNPNEIADSAFAGTSPYIDDIFWGLININHFASKVVIDKLSGNELTRKAIKENIDDDEKGQANFRRNFEKLLPEDHVVLNTIGHFKLFLIERDCGALIKVKEQALKCISDNSVSTIEIEETIKALILVSISELYNATKSKEWDLFFPFEKKYIIDLLDSQEAMPYLEELKKQEISDDVSVTHTAISLKTSTRTGDNPSESTNEDFAGFHFPLPADLFSGKVDIRHDFIPGLKNALKTVEVFSPLFNYILNLGGINSDQEAGALLRTFTGYPVEDADDKAKWGTDYHILYYLVKYMFTPKKSYAKMSECIDIYYPSDDERLKAEKSPSSYAERISGSDAPSVIETLYRLSGVFPKPEEPVTD